MGKDSCLTINMFNIQMFNHFPNVTSWPLDLLRKIYTFMLHTPICQRNDERNIRETIKYVKGII